MVKCNSSTKITLYLTEKSERRRSVNRKSPRLRQLHRAAGLDNQRAGRGRAGHRQSPEGSQKGHQGDQRLPGRAQVQGKLIKSLELPEAPVCRISPKISEEASVHRRPGAVSDARVGGGTRGTLGAPFTSSPGPSSASTAGRGAPAPSSSSAAAHAPAARILEVSRSRICGRKRKSRQQEGGRMSSLTSRSSHQVYMTPMMPRIDYTACLKRI